MNKKNNAPYNWTKGVRGKINLDSMTARYEYFRRLQIDYSELKFLNIDKHLDQIITDMFPPFTGSINNRYADKEFIKVTDLKNRGAKTLIYNYCPWLKSQKIAESQLIRAFHNAGIRVNYDYDGALIIVKAGTSNALKGHFKTFISPIDASLQNLKSIHKDEVKVIEL